MAFLADLRQTQQAVTNPDLTVDRNRPQVEPFGNDIFTERAEINIGAFFTECVDLFKCQQRNLTASATERYAS